jgi:mRNA interferase RelE/StbE
MASYRLEWRRSTKKDLRRIASAHIPKIIAAAERLADDPFPTGHVKLSGSEHSYRIRVGDYRILYDVYSGRLVIEVIKVGHRKHVYEK